MSENTERVVCERTHILVDQQSSQGVLVCDYAGLAINRFSPGILPPSGVGVVVDRISEGSTGHASRVSTRDPGYPGILVIPTSGSSWQQLIISFHNLAGGKFWGV